MPNNIIILIVKYNNSPEKDICLEDIVGAILDCGYQNLDEKGKENVSKFIDELVTIAVDRIEKKVNPTKRDWLVKYLISLKNPKLLQSDGIVSRENEELSRLVADLYYFVISKPFDFSNDYFNGQVKYIKALKSIVENKNKKDIDENINNMIEYLSYVSDVYDRVKEGKTPVDAMIEGYNELFGSIHPLIYVMNQEYYDTLSRIIKSEISLGVRQMITAGNGKPSEKKNKLKDVTNAMASIQKIDPLYYDDNLDYVADYLSENAITNSLAKIAIANGMPETVIKLFLKENNTMKVARTYRRAVLKKSGYKSLGHQIVDGFGANFAVKDLTGKLIELEEMIDNDVNIPYDYYSKAVAALNSLKSFNIDNNENSNLPTVDDLLNSFDAVEKDYVTSPSSDGYMTVSRRFEGAYYYNSGKIDDVRVNMLCDAKKYIYPQKFYAAIDSSLKKDCFNIPVYVQSLIMLGQDASYEAILTFIERNADRSHITEIINEIANFSIKGLEFLEFYFMKKGIVPTEEQEALMGELRLANEMYRRNSSKPKKGTKTPEPNYKNFLEVGEVKPENDFFKKWDYDSLRRETARFDLPTILCNGEKSDSIIIVTDKAQYAVRNVENYDTDLVNMLATIGQHEEAFRLSEELDESQRAQYVDRCVENGAIILRFEKDHEIVSVDSSTPEKINVLQENKVKAINDLYIKATEREKDKRKNKKS